MATYVIGDVQGCFDELQRLLVQLRFNENEDCLWFTGDLVNRGPKSREVLKFVQGLGKSAVTVLGNHDLHLIAMARGHASRKKKDTLLDVLEADDRDDLVEWLISRPLAHYDDELDLLMIHAGLLPDWDLKKALLMAREAESVLQGEEKDAFLEVMYGDHPSAWHDDHGPHDRIRLIINTFTRLRYCTSEGEMALREKGAPGSQTTGFQPWFEHCQKGVVRPRIVFGHWSTLPVGFYAKKQVINLDSGCLWGGSLSAYRVDVPSEEFISISCPQAQVPRGI